MFECDLKSWDNTWQFTMTHIWKYGLSYACAVFISNGFKQYICAYTSSSWNHTSHVLFDLSWIWTELLSRKAQPSSICWRMHRLLWPNPKKPANLGIIFFFFFFFFFFITIVIVGQHAKGLIFSCRVLSWGSNSKGLLAWLWSNLWSLIWLSHRSHRILVLWIPFRRILYTI